jgi:hypothetical protein
MFFWPKKDERGVCVCVIFAKKKKQEDKQMGRQNKGLERERVTRDDCEATVDGGNNNGALS